MGKVVKNVGKAFSSAVNAVSLGLVDLDKPKKPKGGAGMAAPASAEEQDKDVKKKRIKARQNIFNVAGIAGEELKKDQVKTGGGIYSA